MKETPLPQTENKKIYFAKDLSRSDQRALVLHLLYTYELREGTMSPEALMFSYEKGFGCIILPEDSLHQDIISIIEFSQKAEEIITPFLQNWRFERLSLMTRLILRYSVWEFVTKKTDPALIINEAVELAKGFGEKDSYRFINGILDAWIKSQEKSIV
jgi:N utilization substance protein B